MNAYTSPRSFEILSEILEQKTGQTLLPNRHFSIETSLQPIMREHEIPDIDSLISVIKSDVNNDLETACLEAILNNESCFFRDQASFALLTGPVLDSIRRNKDKERRVRIWSSACSFGQEALSLAIAIAENREKWKGWTVEIIGSDVSQKALRRAKTGSYSQFEAQRGMPIGLLLKYFTQVNGDWQANTEILDMINYRRFNMIDNSFLMGKFDLILCRNMLMYLGDDNKAKVLKHIANAMPSHGYLMLGASETIIGHSDALTACQEYRGFYKLDKET